MVSPINLMTRVQFNNINHTHDKCTIYPTKFINVTVEHDMKYDCATRESHPTNMDNCHKIM